jgi:hypothetical protein
MNFQGAELSVGDKLHDIVDGPVTVVELMPDGFRATKGGNPNTSRVFDYNGKLCGRRQRPTLFWHDPIALIPRKNAHAWLAQLQALKNMSELMGQYAESAEFSGPSLSIDTLVELNLLTEQQRNDLLLAQYEREAS